MCDILPSYICEYDQLSFKCIHLSMAFPYGSKIGAEDVLPHEVRLLLV
jgi:hypothetical protein